MKRCPQCRRDYTDETLNFCLDDGSELVEGPASGGGARTAIMSVHDTEGPTRTFETPKSVDESASSSRSRSGLTRNVFIAAAAIAVAAAGFAVYRYGVQSKPAVQHFENIKLDRITAEGGV